MDSNGSQCIHNITNDSNKLSEIWKLYLDKSHIQEILYAPEYLFIRLSKPRKIIIDNITIQIFNNNSKINLIEVFGNFFVAN